MITFKFDMANIDAKGRQLTRLANTIYICIYEVVFLSHLINVSPIFILFLKFTLEQLYDVAMLIKVHHVHLVAEDRLCTELHRTLTDENSKREVKQ